MQCRRRPGARGARHCCHAFTRLSVLTLGPVLSPRLPATPSSNRVGSEKTNKKRAIGVALALMNVSSNLSSSALRPSSTAHFFQAIQGCFRCPLVIFSCHSSPQQEIRYLSFPPLSLTQPSPYFNARHSSPSNFRSDS